MSRIVDRDIDWLREAILRMGALAEDILAKAWMGLGTSDTELCQQVQEDDLEIDRLEIEIDSAVLNVLALQSPVAVDLRLVIAIKTMASDLERVGDLARNIGRSVLSRERSEALVVPTRLGEMADASRRLLRRALDAFANTDAEQARAIVSDDDYVDQLEDRAIAELLDRIQADPARADDHVRLIQAARDLERVADHATNIAEYVVLVAEAKNVKHEGKLAGSEP